MNRLSFDPVFGSYLLVVAAALLLAGLLVLCPAGGRTGRWKRAALLVLRIGAIVMVILALLRPRLIYTEIKRQAATLVILIDQSHSMSVPDAGSGVRMGPGEPKALRRLSGRSLVEWAVLGLLAAPSVTDVRVAASADRIGRFRDLLGGLEPAGEPEPSLDEERLSILKMVEQGQITPEEAEMLLDVLV